MRDDKPGTERCPRCDHIECRCGYSDEPDRCDTCGVEVRAQDRYQCAGCAQDEGEVIAERRRKLRNEGSRADKPDPESEAEYVIRTGGEG